jgi:endonuclease YncB( thermonuclease family)
VSNRLLLVVLAFALAAPVVGTGAAALATQPKGTVLRITDGDTLVLAGGARIRLVQIDAPEAGGECYAAQATTELARLAPPGAAISLEVDPHLDRADRFGRLLRYVHARGRNVNLELVRRGAATPYFYGGARGRYAHALLAAVSQARGNRRGLWGVCLVSWAEDGPVDTKRR